MDPRQASQLRAGMLLIALGLLFLTSQLQAWTGLHIGRLWPFVLIALGVGFLLFPGEGSRWPGGLWLIFVGGIFLLHTYRVVSIRDSWPLFLVATGLSVLAGGVRRPAPPKEG